MGYRYNEFIVIFRELLKKGCDINAQTFNGHTALHMAVDKRSVLMTLELLKHGANFNLLDTAHAKYRRPPQTTADQPQTNRRTLNTADLDFFT